MADSGLPVLEVNGPQQRGDDFGTRLANALAHAFAQGYERVIAVGSDCPRLHEVDWQAVTACLDDGVPVLGPTRDRDGTYLIGLRRSDFEKADFAALPWQSPALFAALDEYLAERSGMTPARLAPRGDVNGHDELLALLRSPSSSPAVLLVALQAVFGPTKHDRYVRSRPARVHLRGRRSRAPPSLRRSTRASA